jgi:hypothetical protein
MAVQGQASLLGMVSGAVAGMLPTTQHPARSVDRVLAVAGSACFTMCAYVKPNSASRCPDVFGALHRHHQGDRHRHLVAPYQRTI